MAQAQPLDHPPFPFCLSSIGPADGGDSFGLGGPTLPSLSKEPIERLFPATAERRQPAPMCVAHEISSALFGYALAVEEAVFKIGFDGQLVRPLGRLAKPRHVQGLPPVSEN